jgi:hypothetical protein
MREFEWVAFKVRVLDTANSKAEAIAKERLFVHLFEANDPNFGYNDPSLYKAAA